jgi:molybdate-binding protein
MTASTAAIAAASRKSASKQARVKRLHDFMLGLRGSNGGVSGVQIFDLGTGSLVWSDRRTFSTTATAATLTAGLTSTTGFVLQYGLTESMVSWKDVTDGKLGLNNLRISSFVTAPEPSGTALLATGLGLAVVILRRRRRV